MRSLLLCSSLVAAALFAVACTGSAPAPNVAKTPANSASPAPAQASPQVPQAANPVGETKELFAAHCMICHKDNGKGGKVSIQGKTLNAEDLTSAEMTAKTDDQLTKYIVDGEPDEGMPAFKGKLTDEEIKLLVGHIRSLQGKTADVANTPATK
jgi:mono/diheme cytochrome c family protein